MNMDKTDAQNDLNRRHDLPVIRGVYRHYKGGLYVVESIGLLEDLHGFLREVSVPEDVIKTIPDEAIPLLTCRSNAKNTHWLRTLKNFQEEVEVEGEPGTGHPILEKVKRLVSRFRRETD